MSKSASGLRAHKAPVTPFTPGIRVSVKYERREFYLTVMVAGNWLRRSSRTLPTIIVDEKPMVFDSSGLVPFVFDAGSSFIINLIDH